MKKLICTVLSLALAISLCACGGENGTTSSAQNGPIQSTPVTSGDSTIVYGLTNSWGSLNPYHVVNYTGFTVHDKLWEILYSVDEEGNLINRSCESYEVQDGGRVFVMKLRDDVLWDDGTPVTAHDWVFALEMVCDPAVVGMSGKTYFAPLVGVDESGNKIEGETIGLEAVDDYTLKFTLDQSANYELFWLNYYRFYHPLPEHILGDTAPEDFVNSEFWMNPVGCGPFKFVSTIPGEEVTLARNENFYHDIQFETLIIRKISAANSVSALATGEVDVFPSVQLDDLEALRNTPGVTLYKANQTEYLYCHINNNLCNQKVRQAINLAIDKQLIVDQIFNGEGIPAECAISPESPYWGVDTQSGRDVEKAKQLLAESGWDSSTVLRLATPADFREDVAVIIQQNLAEIGIAVELFSCDQTAMQAGLTDGIYDMGMQTWGMHYRNPTYFQICQTPGSSVNLSFIETDDYANMAKAIDAAQTEEEVYDLTQEYIQYMCEDLGQIGIAHRNAYSAWSAKVAKGATAMAHDLVWEWELA